MNDLATANIPPPRFVIEPLLPRRLVTLLAGHGDAGKTLLALTLAVHIACGTRWGELHCAHGRVLYVSLEDDDELIRLRLRRIAELYMLDLDAIAKRVTVLVPADDEDGALAYELTANGETRLVLTPAFDEIRAAGAGHDAIIIDNASDAYDANENVRRLVRRFVRALQRIAREHDASVVLLAHIDKAGARYGTAKETYSGSTAWHNSCRSRLALLETDAGLELRHEKHNVSAGAEPIAIERAEHGIPRPISHADKTDRADADATAVAMAIRAAIADGLTVTTAGSGPRTVYDVLATRPELPEDLAADRKRVKAALVQLERQGRVGRETYTDQWRKSRERYAF